ncbi:MAG TPA: sialate O-acetylesterase [Puia sp.]|nr:sialate O-acetylesterase [Puia sp.]
MRKILLLVSSVLSVMGSRADVRLPSILSANMVLQQQSRVSLWGWCDPGEKVCVTASWDGRPDSTKGDRDGRWKLVVSTPSAGGPYTITIKGWNTIVLDNILIGEVWVCSGQSNMEMCETWGLPDVRRDLPGCHNPNIRFFHIPRTTSHTPQDNCPGQWTACDSNTLKQFSAVAYYFGKRLNGELNVPIGLIEAAWGGTPAEVWTPAGLIEGDDSLRAAAGKQKPYDGWPYKPGYCYNAMIAPLTPFSIAGAIWYQGEANVPAPGTYERLLTTMIASWRQAWALPLPFYYVQIAPWTYGVKDQAAVLREQQSRVQHVENTGMVVISDLVDDTTNIHPKDKHDVGARLAAWALANTYHRPGIRCKGPAFQNMEIKGDRIIITCSNAGGGLKITGGQVRQLFVAGEDRVFRPATAKIDGNRLIVSAPGAIRPVAVRYQFDNAGIGNIISEDGLPLEPFRTDDWPVDID